MFSFGPEELRSFDSYTFGCVGGVRHHLAEVAVGAAEDD